jgi:heat shock protein HtpX
MSITATRFATHLRTWLLIAGLTGLLLAIGVGALYLFVALAIGMNLISYWFSDKIALRASRAKPLEHGRAPWLERIVDDLAHRSQVPVPRMEQPNAFATGRNPRHAAVAVTEGLLELLPAEQVKGVLAHEFGHIKNHDILICSIAAMFAGAISAIANILQFSMFSGRDEDSLLGFIGTLAAIIVAPITQAIPMNFNPAQASLYAVNPLQRRGLATLFMTHPPTAERIRQLQAMNTAQRIQLAA